MGHTTNTTQTACLHSSGIPSGVLSGLWNALQGPWRIFVNFQVYRTQFQENAASKCWGCNALGPEGLFGPRFYPAIFGPTTGHTCAGGAGHVIATGSTPGMVDGRDR